MAYGYIEGYKISANRLVEYVNNEGKDQDFLVYPIVFLYRHHLELILKEIIYKGRLLLNKGNDHPKHHSIDKLWVGAKDIIKEVWKGNDDPDEFEFIDHFVKEFAKADPNSMSFRYSKDIKGQKTLKDLKYINLRHLSECINTMSDFLEGVRFGINEYLDDKYEMLSELSFDM